jgi:hypothetical protein
MPRSSWTPADPPEPHQIGSFVLASSSLTLSPSALQCFHCYQLTRLYQASGSTVSLMAYVVLCVRFNYFVRLFLFCLLHNCNTRYGWLVRPCPARTFTLQEMPSFAWRTNGFELSGRGIPDRYLFYPTTSYKFASKSRSTPGPFQRIVMRQ